LGSSRPAKRSQFLNLTLLAPDIQEAALKLEAINGVPLTSERALREIVAAVEWEGQRRVWEKKLLRSDG